jgi:hypothetical protein
MSKKKLEKKNGNFTQMFYFLTHMFLFFVQYQKWDIHIGLTQIVFIEKWI